MMKKLVPIGLALLLCVGLFLVVACKRSKEVAFVVLASGEHDGNVSDYYQIITDEIAYLRCGNSLLMSLPSVDFSSCQVVAVFDTLRRHPLYHIGIEKITEESNYVNVQVKRDYDSRRGGPSQTYVVVRIPRIQKDIHFENLPFIGEPFDDDVPTEGVSSCIDHVYAAKAGNETLYFKFMNDGVLWLEHRGMELNCAETLVETSVRFETDCLYIKEDERLGADSMLALCTCVKNVGYRTEGIVPETDSLQIELVFSTFERGQSSRSFKIPSSGSVEVIL